MGNYNERTYSVGDVELILEDARQGYEQKIEAKDELITNLKAQNQEMQNIIARHIETEQQLSNSLQGAEQKLHSMEASIKNVYELKTRQMMLLYKKLEKNLNELQMRYQNYISVEEINHLTSDFQIALTLTLEDKGSYDGVKPQTVFSEPQTDFATYQTERNENSNYKHIAHTHKSLMGKSLEDKLCDNLKLNHSDEGQTQSTAEQFLSTPLDGNIMLKSMGKNRMNNIIPRGVKPVQAQNDGFSLAEALVPNESLEEIMLAFDIEK